MELVTDSSSDRSLSETVVEAVATREGDEPTELEPLYETIDPDALDSLFKNGNGEVVFEYHGYDVRATGEGEVELVGAREN